MQSIMNLPEVRGKSPAKIAQLLVNAASKVESIFEAAFTGSDLCGDLSPHLGIPRAGSA